MSVEGVVNVAGFYRRRGGLIDIEEVTFGYDEAAQTAAMLMGQNVPASTWWFAELPQDPAAKPRIRVFQLDGKWLSQGTVDRIHKVIAAHFGRSPEFA